MDSRRFLPGTLDLLILKAVSLGPRHGYGVLLRIEQISGGSLHIEQGALYPALFRLEHQGLLQSEWGTSDNNRRGKVLPIDRRRPQTAAKETESWNRLTAAMASGAEHLARGGVAMLARIRSYWRGFFRRSKLEHDLAEELRLHIEERADASAAKRPHARGSRRRARLEFGESKAIRSAAVKRAVCVGRMNCCRIFVTH